MYCRSFRRRAIGVNVGNAIALTVDPADARLICNIQAQRISGLQSWPFSDHYDQQASLQQPANMVCNGDACLCRNDHWSYLVADIIELHPQTSEDRKCIAFDSRAA